MGTKSKHSIEISSGSQAADSNRKLRLEKIRTELDPLLKATEAFVIEHLEEEDLDPEAKQAIEKATEELAYRKQYYDVIKDEIVWFPSVSRLVLKGDLTAKAEDYYYDEEDEWPLEYTKALKTVVREQNIANEKDEDNELDEENEAYMEELATDIEL